MPKANANVVPVRKCTTTHVTRGLFEAHIPKRNVAEALQVVLSEILHDKCPKGQVVTVTHTSPVGAMLTVEAEATNSVWMEAFEQLFKELCVGVGAKLGK